MPRIPLIPAITRAAAVVLAATGLGAGVAQTASASPLSTIPLTFRNTLPTSVPTPNPSPSSGSLLWNGTLGNGFGNYSFVWSCPGGVSLTSSPSFEGRPSAQFLVDDSYTMSNCPNHVFTPNPSSSLLSPYMFSEGSDDYVAFSTYFPVGFPTITNWFQFAEFDGPPFNGSPSIGFDVVGHNLGMWRDATHSFDNPWRAPIHYGAWENIVAHVKFSTNPSVGFVELWLNGVQQHFTNGAARLYYSTLVTGNNWNGHTPEFLNLNQYRALHPSLGPVSIYHAGMKVGSSYAAVAN